MKGTRRIAYRISGAINGVLVLVAFAAIFGGFLYGIFTLVRDRLLPVLFG